MTVSLSVQTKTYIGESKRTQAYGESEVKET